MTYIAILFKVTAWTVIFTFRLTVILIGAFLSLGKLYDVNTSCAHCGAPVKASMVSGGGGCSRCRGRGSGNRSSGNRSSGTRASGNKSTGHKTTSRKTTSRKTTGRTTARKSTARKSTARATTPRRQPSAGAGPSHPAARWDLF